MGASLGDNKWSRREILAAGGITATGLFVAQSPVERVLNALSESFVKRAQAEASGVEGVRNYLNVIMAGAPSRYVFDHWLRTNNSDPAAQFNVMTATKYYNSGGRAGGLTGEYFQYRDLLVPHMFSHSVHSSKGARPLTDLLNNMLVIRGYGTGFDGHPFNATAQQAPVGGVASILGLAADHSAKTFEAVQFPDRGDYGSFASMHGKALNKLGSPPVTTLMEGFGAPAASRSKGRDLKNRNRAAYEEAQARLKAYARSDYAGSEIIGKNLQNAAALMAKGVTDVDAFWGPAVNRYKSVIETSMRQSGLAGISDLALISNHDHTWRLHVASGNRGLVLSNDYDLRSGLAGMGAPYLLAESLALAEYTLTRGLVTSLDLWAGESVGILLKEVGSGAAVAHHVIHDMHESGASAGLLYSTAYYRGLAAGLLELIDILKANQVGGKDIWSETVIQLISDFGRSARSDGSGSDHGFNQMVTSVYSGAFTNGPFVVGNISTSGSSATYAGTQGVGVAIDGYNQAGRPTPVAAASTVAELLRVPENPYKNLAAPLVSLRDSSLSYRFKGKLVG